MRYIHGPEYFNVRMVLIRLAIVNDESVCEVCINSFLGNKKVEEICAPLRLLYQYRSTFTLFLKCIESDDVTPSSTLSLDTWISTSRLARVLALCLFE